MPGQVRLQPCQRRLCHRSSRTQPHRQRHSATAALAAVAVAALALSAAHAAAQSATDINNSFSDYNFVPAVSPCRARQSDVCCQHWCQSCMPAACEDEAESSITTPGLASFPLQGRTLFYDYVTYNYKNKTIPDVLMTLKTSGAYDSALYMYCNPAWFSATEGNAIPRPANAIFKSGQCMQHVALPVSTDARWLRSHASLHAARVVPRQGAGKTGAE